MPTSTVRKRGHDASWPLILTALTFVPGVYVALLACALLAVAFGAAPIYLVIYLFRESSHHVPGKLIILAGLMALGGLFGCLSALKGIVASVRTQTPFVPGMLVQFGKERKLGHFIAPLCSQMGTRLPNAVILHAEPTAFVTQGKAMTFNGFARGRILAIGLPLFGGLSINEMRAVIAHEFAHFTGKDTLYSASVLPVYSGAATAHNQMVDIMQETESFCARAPMMLPCWALRAYLTVFHFINMRISRTREYRADWTAASTCGAESFRKGLMKVIGLAGAFHDAASDDVVKRLHPQAAAKDYLTVFRRSLRDLNSLAVSHFQAALAEERSHYDSHPALQSRLDSVPQVTERFSDNQCAISLLENPEGTEAFLSEAYMELIEISKAQAASYERAMAQAGG